LPGLSSAASLSNRIIVIDPGHATLDFETKIMNSGKQNNVGYREHKINMQIAAKLASLLEKEGAKVVLTRNWKDYWRQAASTVQDNKARALFANELNADVFIFIYCDWHFFLKIKGVTIFYGKPFSERFAKTLQQTRAAFSKVVYDSICSTAMSQLHNTVPCCRKRANATLSYQPSGMSPL
jgi:N-acetylmuramoyl-L-alanine amidase